MWDVIFTALTQRMEVLFIDLFGEHATVDPHDLHNSPITQLAKSEAFITTDITLARQMLELKRLGDAWRHAVRERRIELNLGTPAKLLPRLETIEEALDHVRVEWALAVRSPTDASAAVWIDPDTLTCNDAAFGLYLEQLSIQAEHVRLAIALIDLHVLSSISERTWKKAALLVIGTGLRDKPLSGVEYAQLALAARAVQPGIAPGVSDAAARPERTRRQSDEAPSPASVGSWEWPHVFALQLAGLEGRSTLLAAAGVRARAFHRQGGEFAFVFVQDAPADRGGSRAGEGGGEGEGADAGEVGDGRSDGGDSAASVEQRAKLVLVEALMRELVQDLARALHRDLPLELLLPPGIIDIEPLCGSISGWVSGDRVRTGALHDAMLKLDQQRTLARAKRAAAGISVSGRSGVPGVPKTLKLFGDRVTAESVRGDADWLRSLQCKLVLPRLRGLLPDKALKVKLVISSGQGLVVTAMAKAENDKPGAEAVVRALALDQLQVAVLGEVSKPGAQRGASAARARAGARDEPTRASRLQRLASSGRLEEVARTFSVLCAHGLGEVLVFRTELPEAAATWVRTINAKLADQQSITRQGTFGRHAEDELNERPRAARARDTQRIRL